MAYQSVHTGPEVDAAVSVLSDVQDIRDEVETNLNTVTTLAGQTATNATLAQTAATNAQADAASALTSRNEAHTSAQAAASSAAASDAARAQSVVAKNGAEQARDSAWEAEDETRALLSESGPTIDAINAELRRMKYGSGPYPSLELGFVGASMLDRRVEFTRASNATYWDSLGVLQTAEPNEPRFDYDPVTGESLGLLVEGQATNLLSYSAIVVTGSTSSGNWLEGANVSVTPNAAIAPDGSLSGVRVTSTGTTINGNRIRQIVTREVNPGDVYTFSVWLRADEETTSNIWIASDSDTDGQLLPVTLTTEWKRFSVSKTYTLSHTGIRVCINNNSNAHTTYAWGAQLETGSTPTSYIKTEASQVTRTMDTPSIFSIQESDWFNQREGTIFVEYVYGTRTQNACPIGLHDGTGSNRVTLAATPTQDRFLINVDGVSVFSQGFVNYAPGQLMKRALAYDSNGVKSVGNGGAVYDAPGVPVPLVTTLSIGYAGHFGGSQIRGHLKRITLFPRSFPEAKLVELTTI